MAETVTIALDAMGGDFGPEVVVPAALRFLERDPDTRLILVGQEDAVGRHLQAGEGSDRLLFRPASQAVGMDELPSKALRNKKDSSMRV
ncbi:MAG: phosphate acyltransferase, partial [Chromatiales bacterium]